ncbi:MAG: hypothetical protein ACREJS_07020, partial [Candidatus Rokuibacteriota bacterium]
MPRGCAAPPAARIVTKQRPLGSGLCTYCGRFRPLTRDHVVLRSLLPGKLRDHPDNILPACA